MGEEKVPKAVVKDMILMVNTGATLAAIGLKYGVSRQRVHQLINASPPQDTSYDQSWPRPPRRCSRKD